MPPREDRFLLEDIKEAARRISEYTGRGRDAFFGSTESQDAVIRNLEIIGEAGRLLSDEARNRSPDVPWKVVIGMRDRLIHGYFRVDLEVVWETVERNVPPLNAAVQRLLDNS